MDEHDDTISEGTGAEKVRGFIQENLRVITSVFIVAVIAIGIYSYSDRSIPTDGTDPLGTVSSSETEKIAGEDLSESETTSDEETGETSAKTGTDEKEETIVETDEEAGTGRETDGSFVETAERGNGLTHLARRATTHYLEKNADSSITVEHRVYIEDYLRKKVSHEGRVSVGTSVEFSKDLIQEAIDASKRLDERQLENLKHYSARVSEFR